MKKSLKSIKRIYFFLLMFVVTFGYTQEKSHIVEGKGLVGFWRNLQPFKNKEGKTIFLETGNYKVINPDGTYYTFVTDKEGAIEGIFQYGDYDITSDSTYTEHVIHHRRIYLNNTYTKMKYEMFEDHTLVVTIQNDYIGGGRTVNELWTRIQFVGDITPVVHKREEEDRK